MFFSQQRLRGRKHSSPTCCSGASDVSCSCPLAICGPGCSWRASLHVGSAEAAPAASPSSLSFREGLAWRGLDRQTDGGEGKWSKISPSKLVVFWSWTRNLSLVNSSCARITRVVGQRLGGPVFTWAYKVPDEALDVLIAAVMEQTVGKEGSADCFHVGLLHGAFKTTVSQDVVPPSPTEDGDRPSR